ncbi:helix-turn-helix transcriptional regulator [Candidatus Enterococcus clewellii]|uniref:HTH araC/xylS-type domain-containing protein n=1 Tax=Candidatus Enterococcus clewellii TaxID=1834193 RepID=A0A242KCG6_9ENTE|nr:AraC family transcriptional regulator [Enterococcus sp. 9E7_DIV0242]OTP18865.1 hypothetical protein A5888_000679 [Enterococcus sp. 9E7_DIV0242]
MENSIAKSILQGQITQLEVDDQSKEHITYASPDFPLSIFTQEYSHSKMDIIPFHWHPELQLTWVYRGCLAYTINGESFVIDRSEVVIINREQLHSSATVTQDAATLCINFDRSIFSPAILENYLLLLIENPAFTHAIVPLSKEQKERLENYLEKQETTALYFSVSNTLALLFEDILAHFDLSTTYPVSDDLELFNQLLRYMENHFYDPVTITELSTYALINKNKCNDIFKKYTSYSPISYLNRYRLNIAKQKLLTSDASISQIAESVGFPQVSYFIERFKKNYQLSPLQYRKKYKAE